MQIYRISVRNYHLILKNRLIMLSCLQFYKWHFFLLNKQEDLIGAITNYL